MTRNEQNETAEIDDYICRQNDAIKAAARKYGDMLREAIGTALEKGKDDNPDADVLKSALADVLNLCVIAGDEARLYASKDCANSYRLYISDENMKTAQGIVLEIKTKMGKLSSQRKD